MSRVALGMVIGLGAGVIFGAALGIHAEGDSPVIATPTVEAAAKAGVDPIDLQGAVNDTKLDPFEYLYLTGELERPRPPSLREYAYTMHPDVAYCIERIAQVESNGWYTRGWNPIAIGGGQHASGLGGFLPSTWASTPQGRAGMSIWDGYAQVDAIAWMLHAGRGREFAAVVWGRC